MHLGSILESSEPLQPTEYKIYFNIFYKWVMITHKKDSASCVIPYVILRTDFFVVKQNQGRKCMLLK